MREPEPIKFPRRRIHVTKKVARRRPSKVYGPGDILTSEECAAVVAHMSAKRYEAARTKLVVFLLAVGCGLRASEIAQLRFRDVDLSREVPHVTVRGKGDKTRSIPLTLSTMVLPHIRTYHAIRREMGAGDRVDAPFVVHLRDRNSRGVNIRGKALSRFDVRRAFGASVASAGIESRRTTTHCGRHTFISYLLAAGISAVEVRDWAGHSSMAVTERYAHRVQAGNHNGKLYPASAPAQR